MASTPFNWTCPYCGQHATITHVNYDEDEARFSVTSTSNNDFALVSEIIKCPNAECGEIQLKSKLMKYGTVETHRGKAWAQKTKIDDWRLIPRSRARPLPKYVPEEIRNNYLEACLILSDSPKASAAMSRRCLQGIVRDFWSIPASKRGNLGSEINHISKNLDEDTLASIKAVREVGDIGAHMEKAVDSIVDVEPFEAELLVELIETLIDDWYVSRYRRSQRNSSLQKVVADKRDAKKISKEALLKIEDNSSD